MADEIGVTLESGGIQALNANGTLVTNPSYSYTAGANEKVNMVRGKFQASISSETATLRFYLIRLDTMTVVATADFTATYAGGLKLEEVAVDWPLVQGVTYQVSASETGDGSGFGREVDLPSTDSERFSIDTTWIEVGTVLSYDGYTGGDAVMVSADVVSNGTPPPTLDSIPATITPGEPVTLTGTNFGATQGTVDVEGVAQTVTAWSDTSITFTAVLGNNNYASGKTLTVTTDGAETVTGNTQFTPDTANGYGAIQLSNPNTTDESSVAFNTTAVTGDWFEWHDVNTLGGLTIDAQGFITNVNASGDFSGRFWDATDETWGASETFTVLPVPTNLQAINITDTTVRLTWEKG